MRPRRSLLPLLGLPACLLLPALSRAQVVDDSTKVLYGPNTTLVVRESAVLRNVPEGTPLDTTLTGMHSTRNWYYDSTFHQSLGNVGLASRRLLWTTNTQLGARLGRNAFDRYFRDPADIAYYDTRSPYTFFRFVQGGLGEQLFEGSYSRSVKKAINVGIAYERLATNKQLASSNQRADQQVVHSGVLFFARYQTKDDRYHILTNYYFARHRAVEQGGIRPSPSDGDTLTKLYDYRGERVWLSQAQNKDHRDRFHLAHTYRLVGRGLTAFHVLDWSRQYNRYTDDALQLETGAPVFYPRFRLDSARTDDRATYRQLENTVGLLGRTEWLEYRVYGRYRNPKLTTRTLRARPTEQLVEAFPDDLANQVFLGGNAAFRWRKVFGVEVAGEYKLVDEFWLRGRLRFGPLTGELLNSSYAPTLTQQRFVGNHYAWRRDFDNTNVNQLTVSLDQRLGRSTTKLQQRVRASVSFVNISNLVYYDGVRTDTLLVRQDFVPRQLSGSKQLVIGTLRHELRYGILRLDNEVILTRGGDGEGLRIPGIVGNSRVYVEGFLFKKALFTQIGVETYVQSRFTPYDYSPSTQQFFVQDRFTSRSYPVADVFLTADIKTVSVFLKMAYINQGIYRDGYFASPFYTGNPRSFQLGLKWNFFD
ncbi:putative porin [Hymenobacter coalescens]